MKCPECKAVDSIKVVENSDKLTDITVINGAIIFGEEYSEGERVFCHYTCTACGHKWLTSDALFAALDAMLPAEIHDVWGIEEVTERAEERGMHVTDEEAKEILQIMEKDYDANVGMNWSTLDFATDKFRSLK